MKSKNAEFKFSSYFVFMFLVIALLAVFGGLTASMMTNYDVNTTPEFETYIDSFDMGSYANEGVLGVGAADSGNGDFSEYESSFKFGEQVKTTANQTDQFVEATVNVLGLPVEIWYIISGIVFIVMLVAIIFFLRGLKE